MNTFRNTACAALLAAILATVWGGAVGAESFKFKKGQRLGRRDLWPVPLRYGKLSAKHPVYWMSPCKTPEGKGLIIDGIDQRREYPRPHTRILVDGKWTNIYPELQKKNALQSHCDRGRKLAIDLMRARARSRHIWFKGLEADRERERLDKEAVPAFSEFLSAFETYTEDLKDLKDLPEYEQGQVTFALKHFKKAHELLKTGKRIREGVLQADPINAMQQAQVHIEIGADALDAEPSPRLLSIPAYDKKSNLYVVFGGDHCDFVMNDTWVFDPKQRKWFQRHPESAPVPRAMHKMEAPGNGTIKMSGGYHYPAKGGRYVWVGNDFWTYDIAADKWIAPKGEKTWPPDTRRYHGGSEHPSHFFKGSKPSAAAVEKRLAELPVNTWVNMQPKYRPAGNRDWGTVAHDVDRDMMLTWNGGHSAYCSSGVPHYHLGVNRWELPYPAEIPLGLVGASAKSMSGFSFNGRHWVTNHSWGFYQYDRKLKRMIAVGSMNHFNWDPNFYLYNPGLAEWDGRYRKTGKLLKVGHSNVAVVWTSHGTVATARIRNSRYVHLLDYEAMRFKPLKIQGTFHGHADDWHGMAFDSKRDRLYGVAGPPYKGTRISMLDMKTRKASWLKPENPEAIAPGCKYLRETRYIPDLDIMLICDGIGGMKTFVKHGKKRTEWFPGTRMAAYDPAENRWLVLNIKGQPKGSRGETYCQHWGFRYDEKRKLIWGINRGCYVWVLRLELDKAVMNPKENK